MDYPHKRRALPLGWEWKKLGDIITFEYGKGLKEESRDQNGNIPVYGSNGIVGRHSVPLTEKPCIIVGRKGSVGQIHISKVPCWPIDTTYFIIPPENLDLYFLFYLLSTLKLDSLDKSTTIPGLNRNDAYALNIPLPPLEMQRKIVAILEKAGETKRLRAQADGLTNKLLQSVFLEMFGDPVKNPKGWKMRKIGDVSKINMGQSPPGESYNKSGMGAPLLNGPTEFGDIYPTPSQWTDKPTKICNIGNILFCVRGATAGRMNWADQEYCIGRGLAAIQSIPQLSESQYLYQLLFLNYGRFQATGRGSTFINISHSDLSSLIIPIPPFPMQQKFAQIVEKVEAMRKVQKQSLQQIDKLFNTLMQQAFKGELTA